MRTPIELYIHIPFCVKKCAYCDFLSAPAEDDVIEEYIAQLIREIRAQSVGYEDYHVTSIFFGGGTPSILKENVIPNLMSAIYESWIVDASAEISVECNPGTATANKLSLYQAAGVNRISIGLQSAIASELKTLGRIHSYDDFLRTYEDARNAGFNNISVDLMSGIPGQAVDSFKESLQKVVMLKPEHVSVYSLIVEEGTEFFEKYGSKEGKKLLPDEDTDREMYHLTKAYLEENGFYRYEISNYTHPGYECRHNIGYWKCNEYLGMGLGASSFVKGHRFHSLRTLEEYMQVDMLSDITPLYQDLEALSKDEQMEEFMFMGLRMTEGVSGKDFMDRFGLNMFDEFQYQIWKHSKNGLLYSEMPMIKLTDKGMDLANVVMSDFVNHRRR